VVLHNRDTGKDRACDVPYPLYLISGKFHAGLELKPTVSPLPVKAGPIPYTFPIKLTS
jgi:hypothetical protein